MKRGKRKRKTSTLNRMKPVVGCTRCLHKSFELFSISLCASVLVVVSNNWSFRTDRTEHLHLSWKHSTCQVCKLFFFYFHSFFLGILALIFVLPILFPNIEVNKGWNRAWLSNISWHFHNNDSALIRALIFDVMDHHKPS